MADPPIPSFPPTSSDAQYSMVISVMMSVLCWLVNYGIVADLRWADAKLSPFVNCRIVATQFRSLGGMFSLLMFLSGENVPAAHPYGDHASGFAVSYIAWLIAYDVYHASATFVYSLVLGVRPAVAIIAAAVQYAQMGILVAALFLSARNLSIYSGETSMNWSLVSAAMRWGFSSAFALMAFAWAVLPAASLRVLQSLKVDTIGT